MRTDEAELLAQWAMELTTALQDTLGQHNHYFTCARVTAKMLMDKVEQRRQREAAKEIEFRFRPDAGG